jgi:hypothetical protein
MLPREAPVILYFVKEESKFDVGYQIVESPCVAFFEDANYLAFFGHDVSLIDEVVYC